MDRIEKVLRKLSARERDAVRTMLAHIISRDRQGLDVEKLKGRDGIFRVRKRSLRIIYRVGLKNEVFILAIERRSETTYQ